MRLLIIALFLSHMFPSCTASTTYRNIENTNVTDTQSNIKEQTEQLKRAYQKLSTSPYTIKYQQEYFAAFPNTFTQLNSIFGYTDKEPMGKDFNPGPLYNEAESYVSVFFNLRAIEKSEYYNRMIDVSINGRWYADGVNYFKHGMGEKVNGDIDLFCELLSKRNEKEIKSFWYFYFDSPHPIKELPVELQKVKEIDSKIFSLMELALKEVQQSLSQ